MKASSWFFDKKNNARTLRKDEFRVWCYGESMVTRSLGIAFAAKQHALSLGDMDSCIVDADGQTVYPVEEFTC